MNRRAFVRATARLAGMSLTSLLLKACSWAPPAPAGPAAAATTPAPTATPRPASPPAPSATATGAAAMAGSATPAAAATAAVSPSPAASATPTIVRRDPMMARVAFVKTQDRTAGVSQALDLLGIESVKGKTLFLKPNLNSADAAPGSTHNDTLSALVRALQAAGAGPITVGDRSGMGDTRAVMQSKGVFRLADELGLATVVLDELEASDWQKFDLADDHWQQGFALARPALEADGVVQTCCLKTHRFGGHFTLSLKNSVGLVAKWVPGDSYNYMSELHNSPDQRRMIAEINRAYQPDLILLDGVEALVDGGPDVGTRVEAQVILAGTDRVAIDAIGVAILRYFGTTPAVSQGRIFEQEQIARAVELGLGVAGPDQIELVTDDPDSAAYAAEIRRVLLLG